jgi:hypothetical protein
VEAERRADLLATFVYDLHEKGILFGQWEEQQLEVTRPQGE